MRFRSVTMCLALLGNATMALGLPSGPGSTAMPSANPGTATAQHALPTYGTTVDAEGKILSFSMPGTIDVEHSADGATLTVRPVQKTPGGGVSLELVGPVPTTATGTYTGVMSFSFDYN